MFGPAIAQSENENTQTSMAANNLIAPSKVVSDRRDNRYADKELRW